VESLILALRRTDSERSQLATSRSCSRVTRCCSDRRRLGLSREVTEGTSCSRAPDWACGVCCMLVLPHGVLVRPTACREGTGPGGVPPAELVAGSNLCGTITKCGHSRHVPALTQFGDRGHNRGGIWSSRNLERTIRARGGVMSELLLDRAGRRRSPATMPGFHAAVRHATTRQGSRDVRSHAL
jgi:hypothetical protein